MMRGALLQLTSSDDPADNCRVIKDMMEDAVSQGAAFIATPEVTNCVSLSRSRQMEVLHPEETDPHLSALQNHAAKLSVWLFLGSFAVKTDDADGRFANRSFLINPDGDITARYDKIHMFDVDINETERFRESDGYRPGTRATLAETPFGPFGMTICYDVRFPYLYSALAQAGARFLMVPSAFSPVTGAAHWHSLLRARAIENGAFVLAPAQTGTHRSTAGKQRKTFGHSLVVSPWGDVILDAGTAPGVYVFDLDLNSVDDARRKVPSLHHARRFTGPE